jgi:hypothetical protein
MPTTATWNDLFLTGSVVDLQCSLWRARTKIKPSDLGIEDTDAVHAALSLGCHRLAPAEAFEAIHEQVAAARRAVDNHSLPFGLIRGARYVPDTALPKLLGELRARRDQFTEAVAAFVRGYDAMLAEHMPTAVAALRAAARSPEAAEATIRRLRDEYPTAEEVAEKFSLGWNVYAISGARSAMAQSLLDQEVGAVKGIVRDMVVQLREEVRAKVADVLGLVERGGKLQDRSLEAAIAVIDRVEGLNVLGDYDLTRQLGALRAALQSIEAGKRVTDAAVTSLEGVKTALEKNVEAAVAAAEERLCGLGRRQIEG